MNIKKINDCHKLVAGGEGHILFVGQTGSSKTMAIETFVLEHHKAGQIIVYIESAKANLESGACAFEPTAKYHLDKLKFQGEEPSKKEIKIYHLNSGIPTFKEVPEMNIWTMNIKKFDRLLTSFLFENATETSSLSILNTIISRLKKDEGFFDLILKLKKGNLKKKDDLFELESKASSININTILNFLGRFKDHPIIMPENFESNLDIVKILQDQKPYHIFSNRYINDSKIRDLSTLYILNEIRKAKAEGKIKQEIIIVLDEIKTMCPNSPIYDFQKILSKLIVEILSVCRSLGIRIIGASQQYNEIDSSVRHSFSDIIIGRTTALQELEAICRIANIETYEREEIMRLGFNQFYFLSEWLGERGAWTFHLPTHAHAERNQVFDKLFKEEYPEKMKNHKEIVKAIKNSYKEQRIQAENQIKSEMEEKKS